MQQLLLWFSGNLFVSSLILNIAVALGSLCLSTKVITPRIIVGTILFHGPIGATITMCSFEIAPKIWQAVMLGVSYSAGIVHRKKIGAILFGNSKDTGSDA